MKNVASLEKPPKVDGKEVQIIGADRLEQLLDRLEEAPLRPKALLALFCGLRLAEVLALRWGNVDLDGKIPSPQQLTNSWQTFAGQIGMPDITFHALRHTHASQLIAAGIDVVTVSKRLGHSKPTVTLNTYAHLFTTSDDKAAAVVNDAIAKMGR